MNRRTFVKQVTLLLAGGLVAGCAPKGQVAARHTPTVGGAAKATTRSPLAAGLRLTILHTNDSNGYVDPCG